MSLWNGFYHWPTSTLVLILGIYWHFIWNITLIFNCHARTYYFLFFVLYLLFVITSGIILMDKKWQKISQKLLSDLKTCKINIYAVSLKTQTELQLLSFDENVYFVLYDPNVSSDNSYRFWQLNPSADGSRLDYYIDQVTPCRHKGFSTKLILDLWLVSCHPYWALIGRKFDVLGLGPDRRLMLSSVSISRNVSSDLNIWIKS